MGASEADSQDSVVRSLDFALPGQLGRTMGKDAGGSPCKVLAGDSVTGPRRSRGQQEGVAVARVVTRGCPLRCLEKVPEQRLP